MTRASASKARTRGITRGSGNVFADLNFPDAEERQTKLSFAYALNTILDQRRLTQAAAAARLGLNQPKVSALRNYRLEGFSVERLMTLLNALDQDVEVVFVRSRVRARRGGLAWWRGEGLEAVREEEGDGIVPGGRLPQSLQLLSLISPTAC
jgi:predicted XRE-type DNA-binding protein